MFEVRRRRLFFVFSFLVLPFDIYYIPCVYFVVVFKALLIHSLLLPITKKEKKRKKKKKEEVCQAKNELNMTQNNIFYKEGERREERGERREKRERVKEINEREYRELISNYQSSQQTSTKHWSKKVHILPLGTLWWPSVKSSFSSY